MRLFFCSYSLFEKELRFSGQRFRDPIIKSSVSLGVGKEREKKSLKSLDFQVTTILSEFRKGF